MLTMTIEAAEAIRGLAVRQKTSDVAGLRIANGEAGRFTAIMVTAPAIGDELIEEAGARVFVAAEAAELLADMALDASVDAQGNLKFVLHRP
jgi:Fe-S cluster assembly iron-binding protein IscA